MNESASRPFAVRRAAARPRRWPPARRRRRRRRSRARAWAGRSRSPTRTGAGSATAISPANTGSIYFGYTFCPDVCPVDMQVIGAGLRRSRPRIRPRAARVQPIFISVDPARDTPAVLRQFVAAFHPRMIGLTGSEAEIAQVAREYRIFYQRGEASPGGGYMVNHTPHGGALRARRASRSRSIPHDQGPEGVAAELGAVGAMRERFWEQPIEVARPRGMGGLVRRLRQMLPAQARGRRDRRRCTRPTSPAACSTGPAAAAAITNCAASSCPIASGSTPQASARSTGCPRPAPIGCAPKTSRCPNGII